MILNNQQIALPLPLIERICGRRDAAIIAFKAAVDDYAATRLQAQQAIDIAGGALKLALSGTDKTDEGDIDNLTYRHLFEPLPDKAVTDFEKAVDRQAWENLLKQSGVASVMDAKAFEDFRASLMNGDMPPLNVGNVRATFAEFYANAGDMFIRGLVRCFTNLDRRFKSHDGFKIGSRVILDAVFNDFGSFRHNGKRDTLNDIERVFCRLANRPKDDGGIVKAIEQWRGAQMRTGLVRGELDTPLFKARIFLNGNIHLWFSPLAPVAKVNDLLAEYYGATIPDAAPASAADEKMRRGETSTAISTDLAFYPTPPAAAAAALDGLYCGQPDTKILEPSAGEGALISEWISRGGVEALVTAYEIQPDRCAALRKAHPDVNLTCGNFLDVEPTAIFDYVIMNPPFSGVHWINHVRHGFKFLKAGGTLTAILPVSADVGQSKAHLAFKRWLDKTDIFNRGGHRWRDLPINSFEASGTKIQTTILTIKRRRET